MGRDEKTPPTGTAIPRPRLRPVEATFEPLPLLKAEPVDFSKLPSSPPPARPANPTLKELYDLIDQRISPQIVERISSAPPAAKAEAPRRSLPVRAATAGGRWTRLAMSILGLVVVLAEFWADAEKYRGPLTQLFVLVAKKMDAHEAPELPPEPE